MSYSPVGNMVCVFEAQPKEQIVTINPQISLRIILFAKNILTL